MASCLIREEGERSLFKNIDSGSRSTLLYRFACNLINVFQQRTELTSDPSSGSWHLNENEHPERDD